MCKDSKNHITLLNMILSLKHSLGRRAVSGGRLACGGMDSLGLTWLSLHGPCPAGWTL